MIQRVCGGEMLIWNGSPHCREWSNRPAHQLCSLAVRRLRSRGMIGPHSWSTNACTLHTCTQTIQLNFPSCVLCPRLKDEVRCFELRCTLVIEDRTWRWRAEKNYSSLAKPAKSFYLKRFLDLRPFRADTKGLISSPSHQIYYLLPTILNVHDCIFIAAFNIFGSARQFLPLTCKAI